MKKRNLDAILHAELYGRCYKPYILFIISIRAMILKAWDIIFTPGKNPNQTSNQRGFLHK